MSPWLVSGVSGAAPIWHQIMAQVLADQPDEWPKKPENIVGLQVCNLSGLRPNPEIPCATRFEYFIKGREPLLEPNLKKEDGHIYLSDPVQQNYCLDCPKEFDDKGQIKEPPYNINVK